MEESVLILSFARAAASVDTAEEGPGTQRYVEAADAAAGADIVPMDASVDLWQLLIRCGRPGGRRSGDVQ